jgi:hypothetical protein
LQILRVVDVEFPDGTRITALSIYERKEHDEWRDFGLYMYEKWKPTWPAEVISWPNFGLPNDWEGRGADRGGVRARKSWRER